MKVAFDEEVTSSSVDALRKKLLLLRHPASVMQTFAFTHSYVLLQPQLHAKVKDKTASLKYDAQHVLITAFMISNNRRILWLKGTM